MEFNIISLPGFSEPFSCWSHLLASFGFLVASLFMLRKGKGNGLRLSSLVIFCFSLVFLFSMSGVYHLLDPRFLPRSVMQRLDHAGIWLLIVGTFTPIHVLLFRSFWRWGILFIVWSIAITGLTLEVIFFDSIPEWLALTFYLSLGWIGLISALMYLKNYGLNKKIFIFALGGLSYSVGALLEILIKPVLIPGVVGPHELFHIFTVLGACSHWAFVFMHADYPVVRKAVFVVKQRPNGDFFAKLKGENVYAYANSYHVLKVKTRNIVEDFFPSNLKPKKISLCFFREDTLLLPQPEPFANEL